MKSFSLVVFFASLLFLVSVAVGQAPPITILTGTLLDGKGKVLHDVDVVVQDGKIVRVEKAHQYLQQTTLSVTEVAALTGFTSVEYFSKVYRRVFDMLCGRKL